MSRKISAKFQRSRTLLLPPPFYIRLAQTRTLSHIHHLHAQPRRDGHWRWGRDSEHPLVLQIEPPLAPLRWLGAGVS